jgi:antitoxin ParD1/3/4
MLEAMTATIGFRPTVEDERILATAAYQGETTSDVIRRGLRALDHEHWLQVARKEAARLADEDLSTELDSW